MLPLARVHDRAQRQRAQAGAAAEQVSATHAELETARAHAATAVTRVRDALPQQRRLHSLDTEIRRLSERERELVGSVARAEARLASVAVHAQLASLEARAIAHRRAAHLAEQIEAARVALHEARDHTLTMREQAIEVRRARLDGMAAEIAGALAVGSSCPVCGSAEHPQKALPSPRSPDDDAERSAQRAVDDANTTQHLRDVELRSLVTQHEHALEQAGESSYDEVVRELDDTRTALADLVGADADAPGAPGDHAACAAELRDLAAASAQVEATLAARRDELAALRALVDDLLADTGCTDLGDLLALHESAEQEARAALSALAARDAAETAAQEAAAELVEAASAAGFADADAAAAAARSDDEVRALADRVADHDRRLGLAQAVLAEPGAEEVALLSRDELPDLAGLVHGHDAALAALGVAQSEATTWSRRSERLATLADELAHALDRWAPMRADLRLTADLAAFVEGKSADNRLQMRLSAYVLAYRLTQVVAAANERLSAMSDQRYALEHVGQRGAGETRGGLSLVVRDDWSGETRDPATLSGGETFVVSLALALGLADVITHELGGASLDTLFVDEGFGSLDADTLDDVMDTLDSLRDGGRVVGVVSHVAEMRDRIPTQLVVSKGRAGSTVTVTR